MGDRVDEDLEFVIDDPFDMLPVSADIVTPERNGRTTIADKQDELRMVEDGLLEKALFTLESALSFGELDPARDVGPPVAWIDAMGPEEAARKHRIALAAWASSKDVPHGIKMAQEVSMGVLQNKSNRSAAPAALNIGTVNMVVAAKVYPELEVGGEE